MKKLRLWVLIVGILVVIGAGSLFYAFHNNSFRSSDSSDDEIQISAAELEAYSRPDLKTGTTMDGVKDLLGDPSGVMVVGGQTIWAYEMGTIEFENGVVVSHSLMTSEKLAIRRARQVRQKQEKESDDRARLEQAGLETGYSADQVVDVLGAPISTKIVGNRTIWTYERGTVIFQDNVAVSANMMMAADYAKRKAEQVKLATAHNQREMARLAAAQKQAQANAQRKAYKTAQKTQAEAQKRSQIEAQRKAQAAKKAAACPPRTTTRSS